MQYMVQTYVGKVMNKYDHSIAIQSPISRDEGNMQNGLNKGNIESLYKNM